MLQLEEARARLLARVATLTPECVALEESLGRVLAEPVLATSAIPPFAYSAMDGYTLRVQDLPGKGPFTVEIKGESRTGRVAMPLARGTACRISTGAEIPSGANAVIAREQIEERDGAICFLEPPREGQHIRRAGEDLAAGAVAVEAGVRLRAAHLGLLASLDVTEVAVTRRPRVTILCTGDELRASGTAKIPGKIPDCISLPLRIFAESTGARARILPHAKDERQATASAVRSGLKDTELLLTVGGVSVGEHDWVRPALESAQILLEFWKVSIKPGKPIAFGRHPSGAPSVLGLPGNPASALITFALFGMPLLRAMQGDRSPLPRTTSLPLGVRVKHKFGRLELARARIETRDGATRVFPLDNQASGALTSLAGDGALAFLPGEVEVFDPDTLVEVLRLEDC